MTHKCTYLAPSKPALHAKPGDSICMGGKLFVYKNVPRYINGKSFPYIELVLAPTVKSDMIAHNVPKPIVPIVTSAPVPSTSRVVPARLVTTGVPAHRKPCRTNTVKNTLVGVPVHMLNSSDKRVMNRSRLNYIPPPYVTKPASYYPFRNTPDLNGVSTSRKPFVPRTSMHSRVHTTHTSTTLPKKVTFQAPQGPFHKPVYFKPRANFLYDKNRIINRQNCELRSLRQQTHSNMEFLQELQTSKRSQELSIKRKDELLQLSKKANATFLQELQQNKNTIEQLQRSLEVSRESENSLAGEFVESIGTIHRQKLQIELANFCTSRHISEISKLQREIEYNDLEQSMIYFHSCQDICPQECVLMLEEYTLELREKLSKIHTEHRAFVRFSHNKNHVMKMMIANEKEKRHQLQESYISYFENSFNVRRSLENRMESLENRIDFETIGSHMRDFDFICDLNTTIHYEHNSLFSKICRYYSTPATTEQYPLALCTAPEAVSLSPLTMQDIFALLGLVIFILLFSYVL